MQTHGSNAAATSAALDCTDACFLLVCLQVTKPDGSHVARLSVSVGGVSASKDMAE